MHSRVPGRVSLILERNPKIDSSRGRELITKAGMLDDSATRTVFYGHRVVS